jgi:Uma2 family endonuclease
MVLAKEERKMLATKMRKLALPKRKRLWTYDEMVAELEETNQPTELWDGELRLTPAPAPKHQTAVLRLGRALDDFARIRNLGMTYIAPIDVVLSQHRVVQPDIVFVTHAKKQIIENAIRGVPDLVVEIISTGSWRRDTIEKRALYEQFGIQEYWIVDPETETVEVLTLEHGTYQLLGRFAKNQNAKSKLLKGLRIRVRDIFE